MDENSIEISGKIWDKDESGAWIIKADNNSPLKKDGTLKKKYADMPRYDMIPKYEDHFTDKFDKMLKDTASDIISGIKKMIE